MNIFANNHHAYEWLVFLAFGLYGLNFLVGVIAYFGWYHFGKAHHILYFFVFLAALLSAALCFKWTILPVLASLGVMPLTKPYRASHRIVATVGLVSYIAYLLQSMR